MAELFTCVLALFTAILAWLASNWILVMGGQLVVFFVVMAILNFEPLVEIRTGLSEVVKQISSRLATVPSLLPQRQRGPTVSEVILAVFQSPAAEPDTADEVMAVGAEHSQRVRDLGVEAVETINQIYNE